MSKNAELHARRLAATPRGVGVLGDFFIDRAKNAELWDVEGRRFIDFAAGIAVLNTGHAHPRINAAVARQLEKFSHTCYQVVPYESYVELTEKLARITPGHHAKKAALFSTGAEAVENAIKVSRAFTGRPGVIAFSGAFHGRTLMGMALTGKVVPYKAGFGPFPADVYHAPFPIEAHGVSVEDSIKFIQHLFKSDIDPKRVAAIIIEPVQGEGGFYVAPKSLMQALRKICDEHGILLIADEIQTGFARTGKMFAMDHHDVVPDLMTLAKSLAGGFPVSALVGRADVMDAPNPGGMGGTYAGNPLAVAAALEVLNVIEDEQLCARAERLGAALQERLNSLRSSVPQIADVRGQGFMVAVEFNKAGGHEPDADFAKKVQQEALKRGLILLTCGVYFNVIRFLAPITIEDHVFAEALDILEAAMKA